MRHLEAYSCAEREEGPPLRKLRPHLTFANVASGLALFVALSTGGAYAAHETIFSSDIVDGEVQNPDLGADSVSSAKIQTQGVANSDLAPNSITATRLATDSVETSEIKTGNVFNADIAGGTITSSRISDNTLTDADLGPDSVGASELAPLEPWQELGPDDLLQCASTATDKWEYVGVNSTPAFFRDPLGIVHLKGQIKCSAGESFNQIFRLPDGYSPEQSQNFPSVTGAEPSNWITVFPSNPNPGTGGEVFPGQATGTAGVLTLDGISFRCGPSGSEGCP